MAVSLAGYDSGMNQSLTARLSPDTTLIASGDTTGTLCLTFRKGGMAKLAQARQHYAPINDVAWSKQGRYIASAGDDTLVIVWQVQPLAVQRRLAGHYGPVTCVRFNYKSNLVVSTSLDESVKIWDLLNGRCIRTLSAHREPVVSAEFSYDGRLIITGSNDGVFRIWDVGTGYCLRSVYGTQNRLPLTYAKFTPNARYAAVTSTSGLVELVDYVSEKPVKIYLPPSNREEVAEATPGSTLPSTSMDVVTRGLAFWRDFIFVGSAEGVRCWHIMTMEYVRTLPFESGVFCIDIRGQWMVAVGPLGLYLIDLQLELGPQADRRTNSNEN